MRKIMKLVFAIVSLLTLASCSSTEELFTEPVDKNKSVNMTFTASQEERSTTRTGIGDDNGTTKILWSEGDKIKVFNGSESIDFTLSEGANSTTAKFTGNLAEAATYYAIYPSQVGVGYSGDKFTGVKLKAVQKAKEGSFDPEAAIMVAKANDKNFNFKNVIAYFKVTPTFDCSEIVVTAHKSTDALAGTFDVALGEDGKPTISNITNGNREVKLTGTINQNKDYYILLLPGILDYGFSVTLKPKDYTSKKYFKQRTTSFTLSSNALWNLGEMSGATEVSESTIPYITFKADEAQTLSYYDSSQKNIGANYYLQYSLGSSDWHDFNNVGPVTFGGVNGDLRLRGIGSAGNYSACKVSPGSEVDFENYAMFKFGNSSVDVNCEGDIRTLIDYDDYYCANTSEAKFIGFFSWLTNLKSAPELPILELANSCYLDMFLCCTGLTQAPELPATTLSDKCYGNMFYKCTGLTKAPKLPAENLATYCYSGMFSGCTALTTLPDNMLPANTLFSFCYNGMFRNCESLTAAPKLPAISLSENCYAYMFSGCTGLTVAPELPATTLTDYCYNHLFYGCKKLSKVKMLATIVSASNCLSNWLYNAGTDADSRELTLENSTVYNTIKDHYLPSNYWQDGKATIKYNTQSE